MAGLLVVWDAGVCAQTWVVDGNEVTSREYTSPGDIASLQGLEGIEYPTATVSKGAYGSSHLYDRVISSIVQKINELNLPINRYGQIEDKVSSGKYGFLHCIVNVESTATDITISLSQMALLARDPSVTFFTGTWVKTTEFPVGYGNIVNWNMANDLLGLHFNAQIPGITSLRTNSIDDIVVFIIEFYLDLFKRDYLIANPG